MIIIETKQESVEVKGELVIIYVLSEVASLDCRLSNPFQAIDPLFLLSKQAFFHFPWAAAKLRTGVHENATPAEFGAILVPVVDDGSDPWDPSFDLEGRQDDTVRKGSGSMFKNHDLQILLGLKVAEQSTLGHVCRFGQSSDADALKA